MKALDLDQPEVGDLSAFEVQASEGGKALQVNQPRVCDTSLRKAEF